MISRSISPGQILKNDENFRTFQARSRDILGGDAIQRGDGPSQAGGLTLKAGGEGWGGIGRPILRFDPFERFEKHGVFFKLLNFKLK